ncbi:MULTISPECIES: hypothetical protein [Actinosynnema]|nr:hypothetical protein [Actinosynnema pretiosum]MCP2097366.1 hypothetical protein [Actinosynnema pretiosum]
MTVSQVRAGLERLRPERPPLPGGDPGTRAEQVALGLLAVRADQALHPVR